MPVKNVINYSNGAKLLIFSSGKTKYQPSRKYTEAKSRLNKPFVRKCTIQEACERFFLKILDEAQKNYDPNRAIVKDENSLNKLRYIRIHNFRKKSGSGPVEVMI